VKRFEKQVPRSSVHLHLDGAFYGGFWRHVAPDVENGVVKYKFQEHFDSLAISGHKWFGGFVAGCIMTTLPVDGPFVEYLGFRDTIASGSRDGFVAPMWICRLKQFDWDDEFKRCRKNLKWLEHALSKLDILSFSHPAGLIVVFASPSNALCNKYQLATQRGFAHVCVMPGVTLKNLEDFVSDLKTSGDATLMSVFVVKLDSVTGWPLEV